tara:strand:+ start:9957 stop:11555 length:1599 start_codon:yes stop_codon:yes gene_type:complete
MNKKILIIGFSIVLIGLMLIKGKMQIDKKVAEEARIQLNDLTNIIKDEAEINIQFDDIEVNSIGMEIMIKNLSLNSPQKEIVLSFDEFKVGVSYKDVLTIINRQELTKLESFHLEFKNPHIKYETWNYYDYDDRKTIQLDVAENIIIDYDGSIKESDIEKFMNLELPDRNQKIGIKIIQFDIQNILNALPESIEYATKLEKCDIGLEVDFLASSKNIIVKTYQKSNSGNASLDLNAEYQGENFFDFSFNSIGINSKSDFNYDNFKTFIEDPQNRTEKIEITSNKLGHNIDLFFKGNILEFGYMDDEDAMKMVIDSTTLNYGLNIENFSVKIPQNTMDEILRDVSELPKLKNNRFNLKRLKTDLKYHDRQLIGSLDLINSLFSIDTKIDFVISSDFENAEINNLIIEVNDMWNDNLLQLLIEEQLGSGIYEKLPKNENGIIINISGSINEPKLKLDDGSEIVLVESVLSPSYAAQQACQCMKLSTDSSPQGLQAFDDCNKRTNEMISEYRNDPVWMAQWKEELISILQECMIK